MLRTYNARSHSGGTAGRYWRNMIGKVSKNRINTTRLQHEGFTRDAKLSGNNAKLVIEYMCALVKSIA